MGSVRRFQPRLTRHVLRPCAFTPSPDPFPLEGKGRSKSARAADALDLPFEVYVRFTLNVGGGDCAGSGRPRVQNRNAQRSEVPDVPRYHGEVMHEGRSGDQAVEVVGDDA